MSESKRPANFDQSNILSVEADSRERAGLNEIRGRLPATYLAYADWAEEKGLENISADKKFLEFIGTLNPVFTKILNGLLERDLKRANPDNKKKFEDLQNVFSEYEKKLKFFETNYALPLTNDEDAKFILASQPEMKDINYQEAKKLGLELNMIRASEAGQKLIHKVINKGIEINTEAGQAEFVVRWNKECPNLPMPCVPPNDFWYLNMLSRNRIISNLGGASQPATPRFAEDEILFIDNWTEQDYNSPAAATSHRSELVEALIGDASTVYHTRLVLDSALWNGDPAHRQPTRRHENILTRFGCDPSQFELRLIRQDQYARLAAAKGWGQKALSTNFDNYFIQDDHVRYGLCGGHHGRGGPSEVDCYWGSDALNSLPVRLVLSRKQK